MKIAVFGGCFNPPHKMHEKIARELVEQHFVDRVIFVPTGNRYQKQGLIDDHYRYDMLSLIASRHPSLAVSDFELQDQLHYTYETLQHFQKEFPDDQIYFLLGSDNVKELETWKEAAWLIQNFHFLVINRHHESPEIVTKYHPYEDHFHFVPLAEEEISSTDIRKAIKEDNRAALEHCLSAEIMDYIDQNQLYRP